MKAPTTLYALGLEDGAPEDLVLVDGNERRHIRAARLRRGSEVHLTDGNGRLWRARIDSLDRERAECVLLEPVTPPVDLEVDLAFGIASKQRILWLVEKAAEMGVAVLRPIAFERSSSVSDAATSSVFWRKAERRAAAALTQAGGARLPAFEAPQALEDYVAVTASAHAGLPVALEREAERPLVELLARSSIDGRVRLLVGPEGGTTRQEREACRDAGFRFGSLGGRTLRFETAALVATAAVSFISAGGVPAANGHRDGCRGVQ